MKNKREGPVNTMTKSEIEHLQRINEFQKGWISLISHNFKQTFSNWVQLIDALDQELIAREDFFKLLPEIKQESQNNLHLITEAGVWSNTQRKNYAPSPADLVAGDLYTDIKTRIQEKLQEKNLQLVFRGDKTGGIVADRTLFTYVLERIVDNAIKYSYPGGTIVLLIENIGDQSLISVMDQGMGMTESHVESVFTFDSPVCRGTNGEIGIGLSLKIVEIFVYLMRGNLELVSSKGKGTTVRLILSRHEK